jgi:uncharacterized membrane protein
LGQIVGDYGDASGIGHAFLFSAGKFTTIDFPGAFSFTTAIGINAWGEIVGAYDDANGAQHGFTLIAGKFSTLDFPNSPNFNSAVRVNDRGQIVGQYAHLGGHGFLATPSLIKP